MSVYPALLITQMASFCFILSLCRKKFRIVSVRFETVLFVSVVSIKVRNIETNRNFLFLVSRNKPKQTRNRSCFGLFCFEPKNFIFHFEDTLHPSLTSPHFFLLSIATHISTFSSVFSSLSLIVNKLLGVMFIQILYFFFYFSLFFSDLNFSISYERKKPAE